MSIFFVGCTLVENFEEVLLPENKTIEKKLIENKTISISCNKEEIKNYTDKGWIVTRKEEDVVPCTWKTKKAKKGCNLDKDKGCRITIPDKMGPKIIYYMEREASLSREKEN